MGLVARKRATRLGPRRGTRRAPRRSSTSSTVAAASCQRRDRPQASARRPARRPSRRAPALPSAAWEVRRARGGMSEIAGRSSVLIAAEYLSNFNAGKGKLFGGIPGVQPTKVVIIGAGAVGDLSITVDNQDATDATIAIGDIIQFYDASAITAVVNGAITTATKNLTVDGNSGTIAVGMKVYGQANATPLTDENGSTDLSQDGSLTVTATNGSTSVTLSRPVTVANDVILPSFAIQTKDAVIGEKFIILH